MGNVRHFRRIRKNDAPFLKACVFFAEINIFHRILGGKGGNIAHLSKVPCAVVSKTKCAVCRCRGTTPLGPPRRCVGEWMVPRCYGIVDSEKGVLVTKKLVRSYALLRFLKRQDAFPRAWKRLQSSQKSKKRLKTNEFFL